MIDSQDYVVVHEPKKETPRHMPEPDDFTPGTIIKVPLGTATRSIRTRYSYWVCKKDDCGEKYWNPSMKFWRHL